MQTMTLRGASEYLGISKNRIWRAVKDGHLPAEEGKFKGQKALTVSQSDLDEWAQVWMTPEEREASEASKRLEVPQEHLEAPDKHPLKHPEVPSEHLQVPPRYSEAPDEYLEALEGDFEVPDEVSQGTSRHFKGVSSPHPDASLREDLVAALERSHQEIRLVERRAVELELQLRQHRMLLTENAESLQEQDARAKEAEAKLQALEASNQAELTRLAAELAAAQAREAQARENETQLRAAEEARKADADRLQVELETTRQQLIAAQKPSGLFSWLGLRRKRTTTVSVDKAV